LSSKTKQIGLILLLGLLLPVLFFSFYEIYSLNKTEEELTQIYKQQLESITFAANQYTDDLLQNWLYELNAFESYSPEKVKPYLQNHRPLEAIYFYDALDQKLSHQGWQVEDPTFDPQEVEFENWLEENQDLIQKLSRYFEADYQKKIPLSIPGDSNLMAIVCMVGKPEGRQALAAFAIDIPQFTYEVIGPRLQQLGQDQFNFVVHDDWRKEGIFFTEEKFAGELVLQTPLWLLPHHQLFVYTKEGTIESSVRQRARTNIWLMIGMDIVILLVIGLVFRNLRRELQLAQYKSDFVSNVSHELRTPLALIRMFAETLELKRVPSESKKEEYYRIIRQESERLTGIVNKILTFSELDSGKNPFALKRESLCEIIEEVMYTYEYHLRQKGFSWKIDLPQNIPPLDLDRDAISEALVNLIDNAVKYSREQKHIEVYVHKQKKEVGLSVKDRGMGIDAAHQKAIFDKFFRISQGDIYEVQGTGLGLSLVQDIMKAHQGRISLESEKGKGSTFTLWFPIPKENEQTDKQ